MNFIPKANRCVMITSQVMRIGNASSRGGTAGLEAVQKLKQRPADSNQTCDYCKGDASTFASPQTYTPTNEQPGVGVPPTNDPLYMMAPKQADDPNRVRMHRDIIEHLKGYFDDQIMYYKTMANYNKSAVKRMKRIKKDWTKMID